MNTLKHSGRRAFLKLAGGTALALPLLEFTHGHAFAQTMSHKRFLTVFSHGGEVSNQGGGGKFDGSGNNQGHDYWRPSDPGEALVLGPVHQPLQAFTGKLLVLEGIDNMAAVAQHTYHTGGHGVANVTALTSAEITNGGGDDAVPLGPSIDQVIATRLAARQPVPFNRIHLEVSGHQYGTPYFRAASEAAGGEANPRTAFRNIFAGVTGDTGPDPAVVAKQNRRRSILQGAKAGFDRFKGRVSTADVHVIDAHLDHLRALERAIESVESSPWCVVPSEPPNGGPADVVGPLHAQLIVAALRCGLTNVANLEIADILTPWTPAGVIMDSAFGIGHSLGHMARDIGATGPLAADLDGWLAETLDNRRWRISLLARILEGLDDPDFKEGDRTILDNSVVLYTSEFSNGSIHVSKNVPVLLAGSAGGYFRTGRHLDYNLEAASNPNTLEYSSDQSLHNLFTSLLRAMGETDTHFGSDHADHEGPLPDLT